MDDGPTVDTRAAVVMPVKAFRHGKLRLAPTFTPSTRAELARTMAAQVLQAAHPLAVIVVCDDEEVRDWTELHGGEALWTPGVGLNGAVEAGVALLHLRGIDRAIVAHADLPLATELASLATAEGVTLVPDRHGDGTNVICVPTGSGFRFAYGAGSFSKHRAEAKRLGLATHVELDPRLAWDIDVPADFDLPPHLQLPETVARLLTPLEVP